MAVSATYIAVIVILLILIGFVLTVIRTLARSAGTRIRHDMNTILMSYDDVINTKAAQYRDLEAKEDKEQINLLKIKESRKEEQQIVVKEKTLSASSFIKKEVRHRDSALAEGYDTIKAEFRNIEKEIKNNVDVISKDLEKTKLDEAILRIAENLTLDAVYEISFENSENQLAFFKDTLNSKDMLALDEYLDKTPGHKFNTVEFYDWIRLNAKEIGTNLEVRSGNSEDKKTVYEPSICEGYQIFTGSKLYDYSISKRDIQ